LGIWAVLGPGLCAAPAAAESASRQPWVQSEVIYRAQTFGAARYGAFGIGVGLRFSYGLEASAGCRLLLGQFDRRAGFSAFARTTLYSRRGAWQPALGLELEAASSTRSSTAELSGSLTQRYTERDTALLRIGIVASPLRFQGERWRVGLASLRLGTPLNRDLGDRLYLGVGLLEIGWLL